MPIINQTYRSEENNMDGRLIAPAIRDFYYKKREQHQKKLPYHDNNYYSELDQLLLKPAVNEDVGKTKDLLEDLQANIVKHHRKDNTCFVFVQFIDGKNDKAKSWMAHFAEQEITSAYKQIKEDRGEKKGQLAVICGLYFSHHGYEFLGINPVKVPGNEVQKSAFRDGMMTRTVFNKGNADPMFNEKWHAVLLFASDSQSLLDSKYNSCENSLNGIAFTYRQNGALISDNGEKKSSDWFKFRDNVSQPFFFPSLSANREKHLKLRDVSPLALVLTPDLCGHHQHSCGSFVSFMKLEQHVKAFNDTVKDLAEHLDKEHPDEQLAGAYLIGRFKDGTPVTSSSKPTSPAKPDNSFDYSEIVANDKTLNTDLEGTRCPFHAHIRKANPRIPGTEAQRIVRRGIAYDERKESERGDDQPENEAGLLFLSFQSSLEEQFEGILFDWMQNSYPAGIDAILGDSHLQPLSFPAKWNDDATSERIEYQMSKPLVTFKGGMYLFAPSISSLIRLDPDVYLRWLNRNSQSRVVFDPYTPFIKKARNQNELTKRPQFVGKLE